MKRLLLPLLCTCLAASTSADVLVVDVNNGPGTDFTTIGDAIGAAEEGDVLLVRDGQYPSFVLDGKSLVIQAEAGARPLAEGAPTIRNLGASQSVVLRGIDTRAVQIVPALTITDCLGPVWVEDAELNGTLPSVPFPGGGVLVLDCASVLFTRCTVPSFLNQQQNPGLWVLGSTVTLQGSTVHGPRGFDQASAPNPGGTGVLVSGGHLDASDSLIVGGTGGNHRASSFPCHDGASGGTGLILEEGSTALLHGTTVLGGPGGQTVAPCSTGPTGPVSFVDGTSTLAIDPLGLGTAVASSPVRVGSTFTLDVTGEPGAFVWLLYGLGQAPAATSSIHLGARHVRIPPIQLASLGLLPGSGALQVQVPALVPPDGQLSRGLYLQPLAYSFTDRTLRLGGATVVTSLDASL